MKKVLLKQLSLLCLIIAMAAIYNPLKAQQGNDSIGMGWYYEMYQSGGNFLDIKNRAEQFFATHPDYDTVAELKNQYLDWLNYWKDRVHWTNNADFPGDLSSSSTAMNKIYSEMMISNSGLPYQPNWILKSIDSCQTQNMGVITCVWVDPINSSYILVGTEASGLWETTDGGSTWNNKTESYLQSLTSTTSNTNIPIGFGVSSIKVFYYEPNNLSSQKIIVISTYVPGTDLVLGHGLGILVSRFSGNSTWEKLPLPSTNYDNINGLENMVWKIIDIPKSPSAVLSNVFFASYGEYVYKIKFSNYTSLTGSTFNCVKVFDLHNTIENTNFHIADSQIPHLTQRVRDMEVIYNDSVKALIVSIDGFYSANQVKANAQIFYSPISDLTSITNYTNNASWRNINLNQNASFIDFIALDVNNSKLYTAYDVIQINSSANLTDNETFNFEQYDITVNYGHVKNSNNCGSFYHLNNFTLGNKLAGFGYRYNAFKVTGPGKFFIGGFQLNSITLASNNNLDVVLNTHINQPNTNEAYNNQYHYGIRDLENRSGILYLCTEGGISKLQGGIIKNINGKGLVISQVDNITTTQNSPYDIIINSSFRNGLWRFKCNKWDNYYWEDGGSLLLDEKDRDNNDYGEPDYVHNATSNVQWMSPIYPLHYCRFIDCLGATGINPSYNQLAYQSTYSNYKEYNYNTPFEFSSHSNDTIYHGLHNIYQSADFGSTWDSITATYLNNYPRNDYWSGNMEVIKVAPNNPSVMYIAFSSPTWNLDSLGNSNATIIPKHKIYRGNKINNTWVWTDLSLGISNLTPNDPGRIFKFSSITDIAINPNNSSNIWVSFNMFESINDTSANEGLYRVLQLNNGVWTDYSQGLTSAPVNCIIYNKYSNSNEVFAGTDAGVFYRNSNLNTWQLFHTNNPKWIVRDLEINYNNMMLRAATWGRGVWETPVRCSINTPVEQPVFGYKEINNPEINCGNITVFQGATLVVNANIEMAANTVINVHRGARLIINNATIKSYCQEMWGGIVVDGNNSLSQTNWQNQGSVTLNNCNIEDAYIALRFRDFNAPMAVGTAFSAVNTGGGGSVVANNSTFRNNYCSVLMNKYSFQLSNVLQNNISVFDNCKFIIDNPLKRYNGNLIDLRNDEQAAFVKLYSIHGINFKGCKFLNQNDVCYNNMPYIYKGIYAISSYFFVDNNCSSVQAPGEPCPQADVDSSIFKGLKYGIYVQNGFGNNSNLNKSFSVKNTLFDYNKFGLYAINCHNFYILSNQFNVPFDASWTSYNHNPTVRFYGAYLDECAKNNHIEANNFGNQNDVGFIGLYINNSNDDYKCIYNNTFQNLTYNFIARGNNGPSDDITENIGLKIKCNDFHQCYYDVSVINDPNSNTNGISKFQGRPFAPVGYSPSDPAGNTFESGSNYNLYNECSNILYTSHYELFTQPAYWGPAPYTLQSTNIYFDKATACPAIDLEPIGVLIDLPAMYEGLNTAQQQLNSARLIYQIWVDGGNTEALKQAVNLALPYEAYDLYNNLISKSPYLSDEVMIDAIKREEVLPPLMLKMVLLANPKAIYSARIMEALNRRINRLPDAWIDELKQGGGTTSPREQLESEIDYAATKKQHIFNKILSVYAADTSATYVSDSLIALYQRENSMETDIDLLYFYINSQMTDEASQLLDEIPLKYSIEENNQLYWENTSYICSMLINLSANKQSLSELDESQRTSLREIVKNPPTTATANARSILMQIDSNYSYTEPVDLPPDMPQNKSTKPIIEKTKPVEKLEVYPNPANDFVTLTYEINDASLAGLQLIICDAAGKTVYKKALIKPNDYLLIVLKDYAKGKYIASIINNHKTIKSCKFIVQ